VKTAQAIYRNIICIRLIGECVCDVFYRWLGGSPSFDSV